MIYLFNIFFFKYFFRICSGVGNCMCGKCECFLGFDGEKCECSDWNCCFYNGLLCGGKF